MEANTGQACACMRVAYEPIELKPGMFRDRWRCKDCGSEFTKAALAKFAQAEARKKALREATYIVRVEHRVEREALGRDRTGQEVANCILHSILALAQEGKP